MEELRTAQGTADAFSPPDPPAGLLILARCDQCAKIGKAFPHRRSGGDAVAFDQPELLVNAGPSPVRRASNKLCPDGVERDIAKRGAQMRLVHRDTAEAPLPEMTCPFLSRMDARGIAGVKRGEYAADAVRIGRDKDEVNVVGHQHPPPYLHPFGPASLAERVGIEGVVLVTEKGLRPPIAALGDMVGEAGDNKAGQAGHVSMLSARPDGVN